MKVNNYNNIGIGITALGLILNERKELPLTKLCLIYPIISHQELLRYLGRKTTIIKGIESLIIDKVNYFTNFNKRYYDTLCTTFNVLQYLEEMEYIEIKDKKVVLKRILVFDKKMGKRAALILKASKNISQLLNENVSKLYLNLRVEL